MKMKRRNFMKRSGLALAGVAVGGGALAAVVQKPTSYRGIPIVFDETLDAAEAKQFGPRPFEPEGVELRNATHSLREFVDFVRKNERLLCENESAFYMSRRTCGALMDYAAFKPFDDKGTPSSVFWRGKDSFLRRQAFLRGEMSIPEGMTFHGFPIIEWNHLSDGLVCIHDKTTMTMIYEPWFWEKVWLGKK